MPDAALPNGAVMAGRRDASFYPSPGFSTKYHVVLQPSKYVPACNASGFVLLLDESLQAAASVPEGQRCQRAGCKHRWPAIDARAYEGEA